MNKDRFKRKTPKGKKAKANIPKEDESKLDKD
jgi:hypothetical protein